MYIYGGHCPPIDSPFGFVGLRLNGTSKIVSDPNGAKFSGTPQRNSDLPAESALFFRMAMLANLRSSFFPWLGQ